MSEQQRQMRRKQRKKKRMIVRLIALLTIIAIIWAGYMIVTKIFDGDGYDDASSFEKYSQKYYESFDGDKQIGKEKVKIKYGQPVSTAVSSPSLSEGSEAAVIKEYIKGKANSFTVENQSLGSEEKAALMIGYESYKTPEKAESVAMHERQILNAGEDNQKIELDIVTTYNFSTENGITMMPSNMLKSGYEKFVRERIKDEVDDEYKNKVKTLDLTKFIMTGEGFRFFADGGVLAAPEDGVRHFDISYDDMKKYMCKNIGENVIDPSKPMVALTYDDGPGEKTTDELIDLYKKEKAVCTFFELGQNITGVEGGGDMVKRELDAGCEVGIHSWDHPNLFTLSDGQLRSQAERSKKAVKDATGQEPTVFRAPYGNGNDHIAKIFGLPGINWTVDTLDWKTRNAASVISEVKRFGNLDGQVVLMHSIYESSVEASKVIVPWLKSKGYQLVTISQLLQYKYNETPKNVYYGYTFTELGNDNAQ